VRKYYAIVQDSEDIVQLIGVNDIDKDDENQESIGVNGSWNDIDKDDENHDRTGVNDDLKKVKDNTKAIRFEDE